MQAVGADIEEALANAEKLTEEDVNQCARDILDNVRPVALRTGLGSAHQSCE